MPSPLHVASGGLMGQSSCTAGFGAEPLHFWDSGRAYRTLWSPTDLNTSSMLREKADGWAVAANPFKPSWWQQENLWWAVQAVLHL